MGLCECVCLFVCLFVYLFIYLFVCVRMHVCVCACMCVCGAWFAFNERTRIRKLQPYPTVAKIFLSFVNLLGSEAKDNKQKACINYLNLQIPIGTHVFKPIQIIVKPQRTHSKPI